MKNKRSFLMLAILFALTYWFFDSAFHYLIFGEIEFEFIPSDYNELWMRAVIFILLVVFGLIADYYTKKLIDKDIEKFDLYLSMLRATHHILNNFLNNMMLFRIEAEKSNDFDRDVFKLFDRVIEDAKAQIKNLENINAPSSDIIEERFKPK